VKEQGVFSWLGLASTARSEQHRGRFDDYDSKRSFEYMIKAKSEPTVPMVYNYHLT